jgi:nitroreductase family protein
MIKRMIKAHPTENRMARRARESSGGWSTRWLRSRRGGTGACGVQLVSATKPVRDRDNAQQRGPVEAPAVAPTPRPARWTSLREVEVETWDAIRSRRNVRSYGEEAIAPQDLDRILEAARRTPSAGNQQAWDFVVCTDREQLTQLARVWRAAGHVAGSAATIALVAPRSDDAQTRGWWSMRGHPTSAAHSRTMRGPRWPTPPGPRGRHPDIAPGGRSMTIRWCSSDAPRSGSSGRDSRPARCSPGGPRGRAQHQALVLEQAAALRRRRERRTLAATLARSSVACVVWAGVVSMTPPGRVAAAPALLAVGPSTGILRPDTTRVQPRSCLLLGDWPRLVQVTTRSYALYHRCAARRATRKSAGEPPIVLVRRL